MTRRRSTGVGQSLRQRAFRLAAPLLLLLLCYEGRSCAHVRPAEQPASAYVRVMTYNLDKDSADRDAAIDVIRNADPDVICFQELSDEWQDLLRRKLSSRFPHVAFNQPTIGYDGIGIMSRHPIAENRWLDKTGGGWFPSQLATLQTPLGRVQILNVHLRPPSSDTGNKFTGYFTTGGVRRREMAALYAQLPTSGHTLVIGDFNEGDGGGAVKYLAEKGLADALSQFDRKTSTWQGRYMGLNLTERPDHLLYTPDFKCFQARVIPEKASDHDPVIATFGARPAP